MLLKELETSNERRIAKINKALKESYGFSLNSEIDPAKLNKLYTKISDDLYNLKLNNATARDGEYVEKVLVKEGLEILRESAMLAGPGGRAMERVVGFLADFVRNACEVGDEYEEAMRDAMKQYRSSKYRFDDDHVEFELRKLTADCDPLEECGGAVMFEGGEWSDNIDRTWVQPGKTKKDKPCPACGELSFEYEITGECECGHTDELEEAGGAERVMFSGYDRLMNKPSVRKLFKGLDAKVSDDGDGIVEITVVADGDAIDKIADRIYRLDRNEEFGGYIHLDDELEEANPDRYAERDWVRGMKKDQAKASGNQELELSLVGDDDDDGDDYFSFNRKKGMKEGYVKQLRKLLEAETDQAESLIAAKSFSQELQDMVEKLGRLVNEDLPAVSEQMRGSHGADVATNFEDTVSGTLNGIMDQLRSSKQELDNTVSTIADGGMPAMGTDMDDFGGEEDFGDELEGDFDAELDGDVDLDLEVGDELGGMDAAAGPEDEELGRAKKESIRQMKKKIVEMQEKIARAKKRKKA